VICGLSFFGREKVNQEGNAVARGILYTEMRGGAKKLLAGAERSSFYREELRHPSLTLSLQTARFDNEIDHAELLRMPSFLV